MAQGAAPGTRLPGVDGLRAIAATMIVVYHVWLYASPRGPEDLGVVSWLVLPNLPIGVTLFFVLSGYLLFRPFAESLVNGRALPSIRRYGRARFLRIAPAYWVILGIVAVVGAAIVSVADGHRIGPLLPGEPALFGRSFLLIQSYLPDSLYTGIGPAWSLSAEIVFYVMLPLLALVGAAVGRRTGMRLTAAMIPIALFGLIGITGRVAAAKLDLPAVADGSSWQEVITYSFWGRADLFPFGMLVALCGVLLDAGRLRLVRHWRTLAGAGVVAAAAAVVLVTAFRGQNGDLIGILYDYVAASGCALLLATVVLGWNVRPHEAGKSVLQSRPLVAIGLASYSLYLWHEPVVLWLRSHGLTAAGQVGFFADLALVLVVSLALAFMTYRLVELPALRRKRPVEAPQLQAAP